MERPAPSTLQGPSITLRPPRLDDAEARLALGSDAEIHRMFGGSRNRLRPITAEAAVRWARGLVEHPCAWVIERQALIGEVRLARIDAADRRASLAIAIHDAGSLGKGHGTEAIGLVLGYAFGALGLHRVSLRVLAFNRRAIRCYEKCGFVVEGREREAGLVDGSWHDDVIMGILDREFEHLPG